MKRTIIATALLLALSAPARAESVVVDVNGLVCDFCAGALEKVFRQQPAVQDVGVDLDAKHVTLDLKEGKDIDDKAITKLITDSGYSVVKITRGGK